MKAVPAKATTHPLPTDVQLRLAFSLTDIEREMFAARAAVTTAEQLLERAKAAYKSAVLDGYNATLPAPEEDRDISQLEFTASACGSKLIRQCVRDVSRAPEICIFCGSVGAT